MVVVVVTAAAALAVAPIHTDDTKPSIGYCAFIPIFDLINHVQM